MQKKFILGLVAFLSFTASVLGILPGKSAYAACSGYGCDGVDPYVGSCALDAQTPPGRSANISGYGIVELRHSNSCGTSWARVTSGPTANLFANVIRPSDGHSEVETGYNTQIYTNMVYDPGKAASACGKINSFPTVCA